MPQEESGRRYEKFYREIVRPLTKEKRYRDVCDLLIEKLDIETDPDFRFVLIPDLCVYLTQVGDGDACLHWATVLTEEFDDRPLAWSNMAIFGVGAHHNRPLDETENLQRLGYYEIALDRARKCDQWVRDALFDICRLVTSLQDYEQHEAYMREIMEDLENEREIDIPFLEDDWLKRVPEGKMDEGLRRTYQALVTADKARRRAALEESVPTRKQLDKFL
jgi:hypothetical protein